METIALILGYSFFVQYPPMSPMHMELFQKGLCDDGFSPAPLPAPLSFRMLA